MLDVLESVGESPPISDREGRLLYLRTLYGAAEPGYLFGITTFPDKKSEFFSTDEDGFVSAADYIESVNDGTRHIFTSIGIFSSRPAKGRGEAKDVAQLVAIWIDLDVGKPGYAQSIDEAVAIAHSLPLSPTMITCSGVGAHSYHCFVEPMSLESADERADALEFLAQWKITARSFAQDAGAQVDAGTFDAARILRVPFTLNPKTKPPSPAYIIELNESARYNPSDIEPVLRDAPELWVTGTVAPIKMDGIQIKPASERPPAFVAALGQDTRLRLTWERSRKDLDDQSASGYCLSLTDQLVTIGLRDEQIVGLLCLWRIEQGAVEKPTEWYARTIGKARQRNGMTSGIADLFEAVESGAVEDRSQILDGVSQMVGREIKAIRKYIGTKRCTYRIAIGDAEKEIGTSADILLQKRWREVLFDFGPPTMPKIKPAAWEKTTVLIGAAAETVESGPELTEAGEASTWVLDYLEDRNIHEVTPQEAWQGQKPFWKGGRIAIYARHLFAFINRNARKEIDKSRDYYPAMKALGATLDRHDLRSKRTDLKHEAVWLLPAGFAGRTEGEEYHA